MRDMMPGMRGDDDEVGRFLARGAFDLRARIGGLPHQQARDDAGIQLARALAQSLQLVLFGVAVDDFIGRETQLLRAPTGRPPGGAGDEPPSAPPGAASLPRHSAPAYILQA